MRKFAKDRSMVRPGNASFTGKPTVFTRFWLRYSSGVLKNSREEARTNDSFERHCRDSFQASLEICAFRGKKSVFLPLLPGVFSTVLLFFSFSSSPRRGFSTRKQITIHPHPPPSPPPPSPSFPSFFLRNFSFFLFLHGFFLRFLVRLVSFPLCNFVIPCNLTV